ncbi:unnamed protein product [Thelazia callipaeda]|uniref:5'-AMP-activated protein kinase subunit gamma-2 n=1 Tax=Thelazia callipaeda TaxID=103827 RepID=A0A0N5CM29_THECL|nr:unnamed protein product [Thelazia callipaeda]
MEYNFYRLKSAEGAMPHRHLNVSTSATDCRSQHGLDVHHQINPNSDLNYARLMQLNTCYEAMPTSSKIVVFDTKLQLKKAFNGLIYQNTRHVLLFDSSDENVIVGILSVTDFIRVLLLLHKVKNGKVDNKQKDCCATSTDNCSMNDSQNENGSDVKQSKISVEESQNIDNICREGMIKEELVNIVSNMAKEDIGKLTISEYRDLIRSEGKLMDLVTITAEESLLKAALLLSKHRIHRLPVMDPIDGSALFILTHKRILKFLWLFGQSLSISDHHKKTCKELGVGTYNGIRVVFPDTSLIFCLDILLNKGVSGVPVVERSTLRVVDMYSRFDAIGIVLEDKIDDIDVTVQEALAFRNTFRVRFIFLEKDRVVSISSRDSLWTAITVLVERNIHRLCVVSSNGVIQGIISLSDVINFLVIRVAEKLPVESPCHHPRVQHTQHCSLGTLQEGPELGTSSNDQPSSSLSYSSEVASKHEIEDTEVLLKEERDSCVVQQFEALSMSST